MQRLFNSKSRDSIEAVLIRRWRSEELQSQRRWSQVAADPLVRPPESLDDQCGGRGSGAREDLCP